MDALRSTGCQPMFLKANRGRAAGATERPRVTRAKIIAAATCAICTFVGCAAPQGPAPEAPAVVEVRPIPVGPVAPSRPPGAPSEALPIVAESALPAEAREAMEALNRGDAAAATAAAAAIPDAHLRAATERAVRELAAARSIANQRRSATFKPAFAAISQALRQPSGNRPADRDLDAASRLLRLSLTPDDAAEVARQPWAASARQRWPALATAATAGQDYAASATLYGALRALDPSEPRWRQGEESAAAMAAVIGRYAPGAAPPSSPFTQAPAPPAGPAVWRMRTNGATPEVLFEALPDIDRKYVRDPDLRDLARRALESVATAAGSTALHATFPSLGDARHGGALAAEARAVAAGLARGGSGGDLRATDRALRRVIETNRRLGSPLPESVLVYELGESIGRRLGDLNGFVWPDEVTAFAKPPAPPSGAAGLILSDQGGGGRVVVVGTLPGSPARRAGIRVGSTVTHVDGRPLLGVPATRAVRELVGPAGSPVEVTVVSADGTVRTHRMERAAVPVRSVRGLRPLAGGAWDYFADPRQRVGYVRIEVLLKDTPAQTAAALAAIGKGGGRAVVLDLRGNSGGLLTTATAVADQFLAGGPIVTTRNHRGGPGVSASADEDPDDCPLPLVVLVDGRTAVGAEVIAGSLQSHGRAVVVGERTRGEGIVQTLVPLNNRRAYLKLTAAELYLPDGRRLQREGDAPASADGDGAADTGGVTPQVQVRQGPAPREREEASSKPEDDPQLAAALSVARLLIAAGEESGPEQEEKPDTRSVASR